METKALIEKFLTFMQIERVAAENTISSYRTDLRKFSEFCENHSRKPTIETVDPEILKDYQNWLREQRYISSTIVRKIVSLRSFFNYLNAEGVIKGNPAEEITISREIPRQIPRALTDKEIERLLEVTARHPPPEGIRNLAIIELFLAIGIRPTELVSLDVEMVNLDLRAPVVKIYHRGEERKISLPPRLAEDLERYLKEARPILAKRYPKEKALFLNRRGKRLSRQGLWLTIQRYAPAAGLEGKLNPRTLRYSFAAQQF